MVVVKSDCRMPIANCRMEEALSFFNRQSAIPLASSSSSPHHIPSMASNGFDLPVSPDQAICIARGQFEAGEVGRAAEVCRRVLKERPGFAPALRLMGEVEFHRGNTLYSRGDFNGAVATYGRAVEMCPGFLDAQCNLGNALVAVGKIAQAIDAYERAISLNPDCSRAHWNLALALLARGFAAGLAGI